MLSSSTDSPAATQYSFGTGKRTSNRQRQMFTRGIIDGLKKIDASPYPLLKDMFDPGDTLGRLLGIE